jgi:arginine deiminase
MSPTKSLSFMPSLAYLRCGLLTVTVKPPEIYTLRAGHYTQQAAAADGWVLSTVTGVELRVGSPGKLAMRLAGDESTRQDLPED